MRHGPLAVPVAPEAAFGHEPRGLPCPARTGRLAGNLVPPARAVTMPTGLARRWGDLDRLDGDVRCVRGQGSQVGEIPGEDRPAGLCNRGDEGVDR